MTAEVGLSWRGNPPACPECGGPTVRCNDALSVPFGAFPQVDMVVESRLRCGCGWQSAPIDIDYTAGGYYERPGAPRGRWKP